MKNFVKGDYRKHGPLQNRPTTCNFLGKKQGFPEPATGPNRKQRRAQKKRYQLAIKGSPGAKLLRRLFRRVGIQNAIMLMHGVNRGFKRHPGYPTRGDYDRTGGRLASPRKS